MAHSFFQFWVKLRKQTSTRATNAATIIANDSPASNVGAPHWKGYGTLILQKIIIVGTQKCYSHSQELMEVPLFCKKLYKRQGSKARDNAIATNSLPRSSTNKSRAVNSAMELCLCSGTLVGTANRENVRIQPYNRNCENHRKPVEHRLCRMDSMR
jgi:hypothetical protein